MPYQLSVNGKNYLIDADPQMPLLWVIRDIVGLKGTKFGCGIAQCGACTVHLDGVPIRSCSLAVADVEGKITTIEGVGSVEFNDVQKVWVKFQVPQCGYCQSGQIMSATALLKNKTTIGNDVDAAIDAAMQGNICRCGTYQRVKEALKYAIANEGL